MTRSGAQVDGISALAAPPDDGGGGGGGGGAPPGALAVLLGAVVLIGALDGACQGSVFGSAAVHAPEYAQVRGPQVPTQRSQDPLLLCARRRHWAMTIASLRRDAAIET